jgi:hypothetical protein
VGNVRAKGSAAAGAQVSAELARTGNRAHAERASRNGARSGIDARWRAAGAPPIYTPPEDNGDADKQPPPQHPVDPIEGGPNRQSEKDRPARVDTGTGEIFSDGPPKTFAQVDMAIDAAISIDDLNLAMDLIRSVPDPAHQATLRKNAEKRARDLAK